MASSESFTLASISDGNLVEKWIDWKDSYTTRMKEYKLDKTPAGKQYLEKVDTFGKEIVQIDMKTGLNKKYRQQVVDLMHKLENKLSKSIAKVTVKIKDETAEVDVKNSEIDNRVSNSESQVTCHRCGFQCTNYKRCPALDKQCRKCGCFDHYEKLCKKSRIACVSDGNLIEKWIDWKQSFKDRMKEYKFDIKPQGKPIMKKINNFERIVVQTDKKVGLSEEMKKELVEFMSKMEFDLCASIDLVRKRSKKKSGDSEKLVEDTEKSSCSKKDSEVVCEKCGLCCANYKFCPALYKQCRRCLRYDHYAKMCKYNVSNTECEYMYDEEKMDKLESTKETYLAKFSDGNLVEKWIDWKRSYRIRMREYNFDSTIEGKQAIEKISSFGRDVVLADIKKGLNERQRKGVVDVMHKFERNLMENVARIVEHEGNVGVAVSEEEKEEETKEDKVMCYQCGFYCKNYKQCPAIGKLCRRCNHHNHYARMCKSQKSFSEIANMYKERLDVLMARERCEDEGQSLEKTLDAALKLE